MILPAFLSPSAAGQEQTTQAEGLRQQGRPDAAPVNIATGTKILAAQEDLDFSLADRILLHWQRFYHSRNTATGLISCITVSRVVVKPKSR